MRRLFAILLCMLLLATAVSAAGTAEELQNNTVISQDGSCQIVLTLQLNLTEVPEDLIYPLPKQAIDITVNGATPKTNVSGNKRNVSLNKFLPIAGEYTLVISYSLRDCVAKDAEGNLILSLDLLSGFVFPVEKISFSITLPGDIETTPAFLSGYHQEHIEDYLLLQVESSQIYGTTIQALKDYETLSMTLPVSESMFPQPVVKKWSMGMEDAAMIGAALLAVLYWFLTLRTPLPWRIRRTQAPAGLTAGELGCCLTGQGADFTLMVLSWAQMGYLVLQVTGNGRVVLQRRMQMGNERSDFEVRCFRQLFGNRRTIDGTGFHYAQMCRKVSGITTGIRDHFLRSTGNPWIFRVLLTLVGVFGGVSIACAFVSDTAWRTFLSLILGILGAASSWQIQYIGKYLHLQKKWNWGLGIACLPLWLGLGLWSGELTVALFVVAIQLLGGLGAAYGGRRTGLGQLTRNEILGLRHHLLKLSREEILQILRRNPDYFYQMAPYALALGVDRTFAKHFGGHSMPPCDYLISSKSRHLTARDFMRLLRSTVSTLNEQQRRLPWERLPGR